MSKEEEFFKRHVAKYGKPSLVAEYMGSLIGTKNIRAKKAKFVNVYVVLTAHRFFAMATSKILKKPEILLDAHLFELKQLQNTQANRVLLTFEGKDREIEISTLTDAAFVKTLRTALARITAG